MTGEKPSEVRARSYERIAVLSDTGYFKKMVPAFVYEFARDFWVPLPYFRHKKCIRCGRCIDMCSAGALVFSPDRSAYGKKVRLERKKCIRCYCCHEICPVKAVGLGRILRFF